MNLDEAYAEYEENIKLWGRVEVRRGATDGYDVICHMCTRPAEVVIGWQHLKRVALAKARLHNRKAHLGSLDIVS